jgi:hypothetical protein
MGLVSWTPASAVFWGGLAIMSWASWSWGRNPQWMVRVARYQNGSIGDQAERWLQARPGA